MPETGKSKGVAAGPAPAPADEGFDLVIERLRGVVDKLETGSLGLEQSLAAFEEGVRLSRRGAEILDSAEQRVEALTRGGDGDRVAPMPPPGTAPGEGEGGS